MAIYRGFYDLPEMTDKDMEDLSAKQYHKLKTSEHVQAMEKLVEDSKSVGPTDLEGVVLAYEQAGSPGDPRNTRYVVITKDGPEPEFQICYFLGAMPPRQVVQKLARLDRAGLIRERAMNQASRAVA